MIDHDRPFDDGPNFQHALPLLERCQLWESEAFDLAALSGVVFRSLSHLAEHSQDGGLQGEIELVGVMVARLTALAHSISESHIGGGKGHE